MKSLFQLLKNSQSTRRRSHGNVRHARLGFESLENRAMLAAGGPVVLMGIDAEDGGIGGHGPISAYESVIKTAPESILNNVSNGGTGILVIGGGKNASDNVTTFWNQISVDTGTPVTYVNGAAISTQSFAGFAMLAVVSDELNTAFGGLTNTENDALALRADDVADFVNSGGGLLGFSSADLNNPYGYLGSLGAFTFGSVDYGDITPTAEGLAVGITDALDVGFWHDTFVTYPGFLNVLANVAGTTQIAALGGQNVIIGEAVTLDPPSQNQLVGSTATVIATVQDDNGDPVVGRTVDFEVTSGPNAGLTGSGVTDSAGQATFSYTSASIGTDVVVASFVDSQSQTQTSNEVQVTWETPPSTQTGGLGFWKNSPDLWPVSSLTIGGISYTKDVLLNILSTPPKGDAVLILAHQLIAAKLNVAAGATPIAEIAHADGLLTGIDLVNHASVKSSSALGQQMVADAGVLDTFNNSF